MQLSVLGRRTLVLLSAALAGCTQAALAPVASPAPLAAAPTVTPVAVSACPPESEIVWLPGAEQLLTYCGATLELRDAASGLVCAQRIMGKPGGWRAPIWGAVVSPDGSRVAVSFNDHVEVRALPTLNVLWSADVQARLIGFSADGQQLRLDGGATTIAFSAASGQRVPFVAPGLAKRWQDSPGLNADGTLAFESLAAGLTVWDALKDVALQSFERPDLAPTAPPTWVGPYLDFQVLKGHVLVDARDAKRRFTLTGQASLRRAALSKDGTRLRTWELGELLEWRLGESTPAVLATNRPMQVWLGPAGVRVESIKGALTVRRETAAGERAVRRYWATPSLVEFGPRGEIVARDDSQPRLLLLDAASSEQDILLDPTPAPPLVAFEPSGARFALAAAGLLRVYGERTAKVEQTIRLPFTPTALAWRAVPPELLLADAERLYGVALGTDKLTPFADIADVLRVAVSPQGQAIAVVALHDGKSELTLMTKAGTEYQPLTDALRDMRFSADGKALWVLQEDLLLTLHFPSSTGAAAAAERRSLKTRGYQPRLTPDGTVYCMADRLRFENASGELVPEPEPVRLQPTWPAQGLTLTSEATRPPPMLVAFPAGTALAQPAPRTPPQAAAIPELPLVSGDVRAWVLNADRSVLSTLDGAATVNTFSTSGGLRARLSETASALLGSEDASSLVIVAGDARSLTLWDTHTWQPRFELPVVEGISDVAVSKDGARVAALNGHGAIDVVFADRSLRRYELRPDMATRGLAFDPSGQYLALGGLPLRILRLTDGAVLYGYAATVEAKDPIVLAWVSERGAVAGDLRVLRSLPFAGPGQQTPQLLESFFEPARPLPPPTAPKPAPPR